MLAIDIVIAAIVALLLSLTLVYLLRRRGPGPAAGVLFFFLILFFFSWAGGVWMTPYGPVIGETPWLSILLVGLLIALLIAALRPRHPDRLPMNPSEAAELAKEREEERRGLELVFSAFFWVGLLGLLIIIVVGYAR